jgi:superkiller protein 3
MALSDSGQHDKAIAAHRKAVELAPDSVWAHIHLAYSLVRKGWPDDAIAAGLKAIELQPDLADTHACLGLALAMKGRLDEAIIACGKAIELQPDHALAHSGLAHALSKNGRRDEAIAAYDKAIALGRESPLLHNEYAWLLVTGPNQKVSDAVRAVELAKRAVELKPAEGTFWNTLGVAHYRTQDWRAAIVALTKSVELRNGGDCFDWFFLAMAHWQLNEKDEAQKWYAQAVEWMEKDRRRNEELQRFREEAAALLEVSQK